MGRHSGENTGEYPAWGQDAYAQGHESAAPGGAAHGYAAPTHAAQPDQGTWGHPYDTGAHRSATWTAQAPVAGGWDDSSSVTWEAAPTAYATTTYAPDPGITVPGQADRDPGDALAGGQYAAYDQYSATGSGHYGMSYEGAFEPARDADPQPYAAWDTGASHAVHHQVGPDISGAWQPPDPHTSGEWEQPAQVVGHPGHPGHLGHANHLDHLHHVDHLNQVDHMGQAHHPEPTGHQHTGLTGYPGQATHFDPEDPLGQGGHTGHGIHTGAWTPAPEAAARPHPDTYAAPGPHAVPRQGDHHAGYRPQDHAEYRSRPYAPSASSGAYASFGTEDDDDFAGVTGAAGFADPAPLADQDDVADRGATFDVAHAAASRTEPAGRAAQRPAGGGRAAARRSARADDKKSRRGLVTTGGVVVTGAVLAGAFALHTPQDEGSAHAADEGATQDLPRDGDGASRSNPRTDIQPGPPRGDAPGPSSLPVPTDGQNTTERLSLKFPLNPELALGQKFDVIGGNATGAGKGREYTYRVEVERGLDLDAQMFAETVHTTLNDDRSWAHGGAKTFTRTEGTKADFVVRLASPGTTDKLCRMSGLDITETNVSCDSAATSWVVINAWRWAQGSETFGEDMHAYRQMLINHEVGHRLGHGHTTTCRDDGLAPAMMQQTKSLEGTDGKTCAPNPWPYPV